jgi:hypothetical protein
VIFDWIELMKARVAPIILVGGDITTVEQNLLEHESHVVVVWLLREAERVDILENRHQKGGFVREEVGSLPLRHELLNRVELFRTGQALVDPGQLRVNQVDQQIRQTNQVISPAQANLRKCVSARKDKVPFERNPVLERDVLPIFVQVFAANSKVDEINLVHIFPQGLVVANHDIFWLKVAVNKPFRMEVLQPGDQLDAQGDGGSEAEVLLVALQNL